MDIFSQMKTSPEFGTKLMEILAVDPDELQNNVIFGMFEEVVEYLTEKEDGMMIAKMVCANTPADEKLRKMWEYVELREEFEEVISEIADMAIKDFKTEEDLVEEESLSRKSEALRETLKKYEV